MRNLKKLLALVLAMVMAFSLMLSASAAANFDEEHFSDTEEVTQEFKEAVAVLTGLEVLKGDGDGDIKAIRPQSEITRAEAAALVYRIATGDINDKQVGLYADYSNFTDVKPRSSTDAGDWFAGYVGYCQNAGIIKGTTPTTFNPYGKVTGYEVLAMILRAVGYGKNNEFTGASWQVEVASLAKTKHISDSVTGVLYEGELQNYTLNKNARREIVAELLFRGSLINQVKWTPGLGYVEYKNGINDRTVPLATEVFGLYREGWQVIDKWGNPGYLWKASLNPSKERTVATIEAIPSMEFATTKRECDIAEELDFDTSMTAYLYVNGKTAITPEYKIVATDTVTKVGGEGRLTKVYTQEDLDKQSNWFNVGSYWEGGLVWQDGNGDRNVVTMMDTMLAKVVSKTDAVLDPAGHVITPAKLNVKVYATNGEDYRNTNEDRIISKASTDATNWTQSAGDVILLNAYTDHSGRTDQLSKEKAAFETDNLVDNSTHVLTIKNNVFLADGLTSMTGKQTLVYWNQDKHQVAGEDKIDALTLDLDAAGTNINTTYTWYFDKYNNLIGIEEGSSMRYGVITSVYASFDQGESSTTGTAKAIATVRYADGTTGTETIDYFMVSGTGVGARGTITTAMKEVASNAQTIQLWPVYDFADYKPMREVDLGTALPNVTPRPVKGVAQGVVNMAPVAASNANGAEQATANNKHGILKNNLFKFITSANDMTVAVEVAGGGTNYTIASTNDGIYASHWAATTSAAGKLYKSLGYVDLDTAGSTSVAAWLDDETQIIFRDYATEAITTYDGISSLPGDIVIPNADKGGDDACNANEIDWADTDGDGRAEVLYVTGTLEGLTTYGLFYFNGGASNWNGSSGTATGWLNGEPTTLTFNRLDLLNLIRNARTADGSEGYNAHLFAVKLFNGVVADVLGRTNSVNTANLLMGYGVSLYNAATETIDDFDKNLKSGAGAGSPDFEYGAVNSKWGNPYSDTTQAVYYRDVETVSSDTYNVVYTPDVLGGTITVSKNNTVQDTYHTNPNSKIYGIGAGVTEGVAALAYLNEYDANDVTIVYENNTAKSILEIYVGIDPDITPSGRPGETDSFSFNGVTSVTGVVDDTALTNYLKNFSGGVFRCTTQKLASSRPAAELLYFPFNSNNSTPSPATLTISKGGSVVYSETASSVSNGAHVFYIDYPGTKTVGAWVGTPGLTAGTYNFEITMAGQILSSGSFSLVKE